MLKCIHAKPKWTPLIKPTQHTMFLLKPCHTKRLFHSTLLKRKEEPILTELVYGRKRIYTSLQTIGKTKAATASKTSISSPLSWEWIHPEDNVETKKEWYQLKRKRGGFNFINSTKQNMREMFLPVGYPDAVHDCYKKFHAWLFLETYVGSAVSSFRAR
jgi:hypothetical protein